MNLSPEKRKTKSSSLPPPSFSLLPDEITVNYLARIPRSYYPTLSIVCKNFHSLLSSTEVYAARSHLKITQQCLYICLWNRNSKFTQWFALWLIPNRTLTKKKKKLLVPIPSSNFPSFPSSIVVVGSEIYVIGGRIDKAPSSAVRVLDCHSHVWRDAPNMNVARDDYASSCYYDEKIYIMGGFKWLEDGRPWAEVFDIKTQTWERLPDRGIEVSKCYIPEIVGEMEGKIYVRTANKMYGYDTSHGKWELCENIRSKCSMENVSYCEGRFVCDCDYYVIYIKGLKSLEKKCERNGGPNQTLKIVSCDGKILVMWEGNDYRKKIWCAEIVLEEGNEGEFWGYVEWVDISWFLPVFDHDISPFIESFRCISSLFSVLTGYYT